jgi:hypothetical protein
VTVRVTRLMEGDPARTALVGDFEKKSEAVAEAKASLKGTPIGTYAEIHEVTITVIANRPPHESDPGIVVDEYRPEKSQDENRVIDVRVKRGRRLEKISRSDKD